jgi:hypothetical protein
MDLTFESNRLAGELAFELKKMLREDKGVKRVIAVYSGRFQPFHAGHASVYKALVDKFGKENVFIGTSDKTEPGRSPLNFQEKKQVMTTMFDIDPDKIQQVKSPYNPVEILAQFDPATTAYVSAVSSKDAARLSGGKYFRHYIDDLPLEGWKDAGYYVVAPELIDDDGMNSGTKIRAVMGSSEVPEEKKKEIFRKLYGKDDDTIFNMLVQKSSDVSTAEPEKSSSPAKTKATDKGSGVRTKAEPTQAPAEKPATQDDEKTDDTPPMDRMIVNPDTGREIQVKSALKYPRWKPVYKAAEREMKAAGVDRPNRVKDPEVNIRYKEREKSQTKDEMIVNLGTYLSETLLGKTWAIISNRIEHSLILEAAPKSHIEHPYEDPNMTFGDLKNLTNQALVGDLGKSATEKTDGQNIMFTIKDGQVKFARNTQHTKNGGQSAMTADEFGDFFAGHGDTVASSFRAAAKDVESAVQKMDPAELNRIFGNGRNFVMGEILNKDLPNTIPYNTNQIMLLSVREFDPATGNPIDIDKDAADLLAQNIIAAGGESGSKYKIVGKNPVQFKTTPEDQHRAQHYIDQLSQIASSSGLSDTDTVGDFLSRAWLQELQSTGHSWTPEETDGLVRRWAFGDKSFNIRSIKDPEKNAAFRTIDANYKDIQSDIISPIKSVVLNVGADAMNRVTNFVAGNDGTDQKLKAKLKNAIDAIQKSNNPEYVNKMKKELRTLSTVGIDKIAPAEGLVFTFNGKLMKFTGAFAPVNQIVGIYTYKLQPAGKPAPSANDLATGVKEPRKEPSSGLSAPKSVDDTTKKTDVDADVMSPKLQRQLNQRIINPETKNKILVKTALKYPANHPAHKAAKSALGETLMEGGNQFDKVNSVVPQQHLGSVVQRGLAAAGLTVPHSIVGNKTKPYLGDIDVAIDKSDLSTLLGSQYGTPEFYQSVQHQLTGKNIEHRVQSGLNQFSILVPLTDDTGRPMNAIDANGQPQNVPGYVQLDVFVGNRPWMEKFQSGAGAGSMHKAVARNMIPIATFSRVSFPTDQEGVRQKFQIDNKNGLELVTYKMDEKGKRVPLSKKLVTSDPDEMTQMLFGKGVTWDQVDTFEKMYEKLLSPSFRFKNQRSEIVAAIKDSIQKTKQIPPSELDISVIDEPTTDTAVPTFQSDAPPVQQDPIDNATIKNPETDNEILVKTALKYPPAHPAHKVARRFIDKRGSK